MSGSGVNTPNPVVAQKEAAPIVLLQKQNNEGLSLFNFNQVVDKDAEILKIKAGAVDKYFEDRGLPLAGYGMKLVVEAEKNELDWRLVAAIAMRESTGGKFACKNASNNAFGWGSCKIGFKTINDAIETVARNLGGNNPKTAHHYDNKTTTQILRAYNPPSVVLRYAEQVIAIMDTISDFEVSLPNNS